jgi:hypothetical protein
MVALLGEQLAEPGDRLWTGAAVQHQIGPPVPSFFYGQLNGADARDVDGLDG